MKSFYALARGALVRSALPYMAMALAAVWPAAQAQAQLPAHPPPPMVMPPAAASGATSASNPDNMPVKKPKGPATRDKMMRNDPASDAHAK
ncbi:hypothetical protein [Paraburkholderia sp. J76]|uniref:hypothetical protein n=1 Tax=Paraburkholderia sp. J76 TaxID=2805439 RepID=UPI002ABD2FAD|nr:hypothetical protein [Paraburkholderia sp. J76]